MLVWPATQCSVVLLVELTAGAGTFEGGTPGGAADTGNEGEPAKGTGRTSCPPDQSSTLITSPRQLTSY